LNQDERAQVPYKFRAYALRFCENAKINEKNTIRRGKILNEKYVMGINTTDLVKSITKQTIAHHGIRKCVSAIVQADRNDVWGEKETRNIKVLAKKIGKTKIYTDVPKDFYLLEEELEEVTKKLKELEKTELLTVEQNTMITELEAKKETLETTLTKRATGKSDEELLAAVTKWLDAI
jgi:hypothetical protein